MKQIIILCLVLIAFPHEIAADRLDSLYHAIDIAINNSNEILEHKLQVIDRLHQRAQESKDLLDRYEAENALFKEYHSFMNDSAIATLNRCITIADTLKRTDLKADCYIRMAMQLSVSGFYTEALGYLQNIPQQEMHGQIQLDYFRGMNHLYGEMASYTKDQHMKPLYYRQSDHYRDTLLTLLPHTDELWLQLKEAEAYSRHNYDEAQRYNDQRLRLAEPNSHQFAIVAFFRSLNYGGLGETQQQKEWLAQSALCDIKNGIMDQASLWSLAAMLNEDGDLERSYRYVEYSWSCTSRFSAHVRSWLVSPILTMINDNYKHKLHQANNRLWVLVGAISLLALLMAGMYLYVSRKRRQLAVARNELKETNTQLANQSQQLSEANQHLSSLNEQLSELNSQLTESNHVKEEYIGRFFTLCSKYIDKLDQFRIKVNRKMKTRQLDELYRITQNENMREEELAGLFANFDSIFLHLFPNFLIDLNALLKPEYQMQQTEQDKLPTDARIFALIRLGIDDSSKIAEFLHYSPNTIYNYRARLKSKAIDRENFEDQIKHISGAFPSNGKTLTAN